MLLDATVRIQGIHDKQVCSFAINNFYLTLMQISIHRESETIVYGMSIVKSPQTHETLFNREFTFINQDFSSKMGV